MNNAENSKALLKQALHALPPDFALSDVKVQIQAAIHKLEHVETKRDRRELPQQATNQWPVLNGQVVNPFSLKQTISQIDEMIAAEKKKIEEITQRRKRHHGEDGEDFQAILD